MSKKIIGKKIHQTLALSLSSGLAIAGCTTTPPSDTNTTTSAPTPGGLVLGSLTPTTGDLASIGQNMPLAVQLAVDTINSCDTVSGVNGAPVSLISEDSQTDPAAGSAAMNKLAEVDKVAGVVGAFASSVSSAAVDSAVRNQVVMISPGSTSPVFSDRAKNGDFGGYWGRTAPPDTYQAQALAALAKKQGFERVSTIVINNDYGVAFEQEFVQAFEKAGGTIINKDNPVRYDPKAATLDSEAAAAFSGEPDAVVGVLYAETGSLILKSAYQQGLGEGVTVLLTDGVYSADFTAQVGVDGDGQSIIAGALGTVPGADGDSLASFETLWTETTGKELTAFVPHSWDAAILMMLAAEAADDNSGAGIKNKLREVANGPGQEVSDPCEALALVSAGTDINYQGASGNVDIDEYGDVVGSYDVWQVQADGSLTVVDKVMPAMDEPEATPPEE